MKHVPGRKQKIIAVTLGLIFGFFAWIYTYRRDAWKYWICFIIYFTALALGTWYPRTLAIPVAGLNSIRGPLTWHSMYTFTFYVSWLWPVILAMIRPIEFYRNYFHAAGADESLP